MVSRDPFVGKPDFLLENEYASGLYHEYARDLPIIDYHNHLSPADIASNRKFANLTEAWLEGDHYKWRAMRTNGVAERYCTGDASPEEKFIKWADTVPYTVRNPLYHWTHLELKRYFDVDELLGPESARMIYDHCNNLLQRDDFRVQNLLKKMRVEVLCTTDDPADTLSDHASFRKQQAGFMMLPAFRPDKAYNLADIPSYLEYIGRLSSASGVNIQNYDDMLSALSRRVDHFSINGCRLADHGLEHLHYSENAEKEGRAVFSRILSGYKPSQQEALLFRTALLLDLCRLYDKAGWIQQFHLGAMRNNNTRMRQALGADAGFDSIGDYPQAEGLARFLDTLNTERRLARTIIYNLNPADNSVFATMTGNFNDGSIPGKIQYGSAWWFLDQKRGMEDQLNMLSDMGLLSRFVGMITDSRSFLSFPRHEYFRRILCNLLGRDIAAGEIPPLLANVGSIVTDVCYRNARSYFGF